jgi:hypothetical protein
MLIFNMAGIHRLNRSIHSVGRLNQKVTAETVSPWWLAGDINPVNCLAAYQPKGAADKTASFTNLANVGTYTASEGNGTISFSSANGWYFDSAGDRIDTGLPIPASANSLSYSVVGRYSLFSTGHSSGYGRLCAAGNDGEFFIIPYAAEDIPDNRIFFKNGNQVFLKFGQKTATSGFAKNKGYGNGSHIANIPDGSVSGGNLHIGNRSSNSSTLDGYIYAFAVYDTELTVAQMLALHTAMNLL